MKHVTPSRIAMRQAFMELVSEEPYRKIKVAEVTRRANVNRKTFYLYYQNIDDLLLDIESVYVDQVTDELAYLAPDDMAGGLMAYYSLLDTSDDALQKLLYERQYADFARQLNDDIFTSDFFRHFYPDGSTALMKGYFDSAVGIFLQWKKESPKSCTLQELSRKAADLIMNGLENSYD